MADIRIVTDRFAVAPQLQPADMAELVAKGVTLVINNRPDDEAPGQPSGAAVERAAREAGLDYVHIPVRGGATPQQVEAVHAALATASGKAVAFCRSGTRSITTWALGQARHGHETPATLVQQGRAAGYDLSGALATT